MTNHSIVLGGGCFWCLEAAYQEIYGVTEVLPGYAGGSTPDPSYEQVYSGITGHAEVVKVSFDTQAISLSEILDIFWAIHNPTTLNQQGSDIGTQYRSIILYTNSEQRQAAEKSVVSVSKLWSQPVVTELKPLKVFYEAENYHKDYFKNHPEQAYCQIVINPKLQKLREKFADKLK